MVWYSPREKSLDKEECGDRVGDVCVCVEGGGERVLGGGEGGVCWLVPIRPLTQKLYGFCRLSIRNWRRAGRQMLYEVGEQRRMVSAPTKGQPYKLCHLIPSTSPMLLLQLG